MLSHVISLSLSVEDRKALRIMIDKNPEATAIKFVDKNHNSFILIRRDSKQEGEYHYDIRGELLAKGNLPVHTILATIKKSGKFGLFFQVNPGRYVTKSFTQVSSLGANATIPEFADKLFEQESIMIREAKHLRSKSPTAFFKNDAFFQSQYSLVQARMPGETLQSSILKGNLLNDYQKLKLCLVL